jgi:ATP-dependent DNA ligase
MELERQARASRGWRARQGCANSARAMHRPLLEFRQRPRRKGFPLRAPVSILEIKHDGYRLIARKQDDRVRLFTRRGYDWTERYPRIRKAVASAIGRGG